MNHTRLYIIPKIARLSVRAFLPTFRSLNILLLKYAFIFLIQPKFYPKFLKNYFQNLTNIMLKQKWNLLFLLSMPQVSKYILKYFQRNFK